MEQKQDFENLEKWGAAMDKDSHLKSYKIFLWGVVVSLGGVILILTFMAALLT